MQGDELRTRASEIATDLHSLQLELEGQRKKRLRETNDMKQELGT